MTVYIGMVFDTIFLFICTVLFSLTWGYFSYIVRWNFVTYATSSSL